MSNCLCGNCTEGFVSVEAFEAHRVGPHSEEFAPGRYWPNRARRCLTSEEMSLSGWESTATGWRHPKGIRKRMRLASKRGAQTAADRPMIAG